MGALGNGRRGGRSPPLMIGALIACILVLGFNYWMSSSRNLELQVGPARPEPAQSLHHGCCVVIRHTNNISDARHNANVLVTRMYPQAHLDFLLHPLSPRFLIRGIFFNIAYIFYTYFYAKLFDHYGK